jgi:hypothetical protein
MDHSLEAAVPPRTPKVVVELEGRCAGGRHALEVLEYLFPRLSLQLPLPANAKLPVCLVAIPL